MQRHQRHWHSNVFMSIMHSYCAHHSEGDWLQMLGAGMQLACMWTKAPGLMLAVVAGTNIHMST